MFDLVNDVGKYQDFLPGCEQSQVLSVTDSEMLARLTLARAGIRQEFITRNLLTPPNRIQISLVEGPFSKLEGEWRFTPIRQARQEQASNHQATQDLSALPGDPSQEQMIDRASMQADTACLTRPGGWSSQEQMMDRASMQEPSMQEMGCRVTMRLEFDFASRLMNFAVSRMFEAVTGKMVDAFSQRADALYGNH